MLPIINSSKIDDLVLQKSLAIGKMQQIMEFGS